jgi:hypothetical protein
LFSFFVLSFFVTFVRFVDFVTTAVSPGSVTADPVD